MPQPRPSSPSPLTTPHPALTLHLTDTASHTLVHNTPTSGSSTISPRTLSTLASTLQTAHETASRLDLGGLRRVTVRSGDERGGCIEQAYIKAGEGREREKGQGKEGEEDVEEEKGVEPPVLLATVVAGERELAGEAREAVGELVELGRGLQEEWVREQRKAQEGGGLVDGEDEE